MMDEVRELFLFIFYFLTAGVIFSGIIYLMNFVIRAFI